MAEESDYDRLVQLLEEAGLYCSFRRISSRRGVDLVCNTKRDRDGRLHGNSFWVWHSRRTDQWFIVTWNPIFYRVSRPEELPGICQDCLAAAETPLFSIPQALVDKHGLVVVPDKDFDRIQNEEKKEMQD
jgi:hypothetical protein